MEAVATIQSMDQFLLEKSRVKGHFRRGRKSTSFVKEHEFVAHKLPGHAIGKSRSGKIIYSRWSNPKHAKFDSKDHEDAARLHIKLAKESDDEQQHQLHLKRAKRHLRSAAKCILRS